MNNNQTIEKLKQMRLSAMATLHLQHLKDNQLESFTIDEYLALLTDHEWEHRKNQKITRLIKQANFRQPASLADVDRKSTRLNSSHVAISYAVFCLKNKKITKVTLAIII